MNERPHRSAEEEARDVLAAEEFGVPAPDPALHHGPVALPEDPTGIAEPHDVLAAEEFAMPAPGYGGAGGEGRDRRFRPAVAGTLALAVALALRKRRR